MHRSLRIALIVLCITMCVGTALALSAPADMSSMVGSHLCSQPCLSDGSFCFDAGDCQTIRGFKKDCCFKTCVYCL